MGAEERETDLVGSESLWIKVIPFLIIFGDLSFGKLCCLLRSGTSFLFTREYRLSVYVSDSAVGTNLVLSQTNMVKAG